MRTRKLSHSAIPPISETYAAKQTSKWKSRLFDLAYHPDHVALTCYLLLAVELLLNWWIVENVRYTEIDWLTYMQQVAAFLNGTLDYRHLKGDTGPCVYPAGFLYVYSALYYLTDHGANIKRAQYVFIAIYLLQSHVTHRIWMKTRKLPAYALIACAATSYRIHSIYVLRLFNDPIAVLLFWAALDAFTSGYWRAGSALFSLAVSVKMSILLYAPCLLMAYVALLPPIGVVANLALCALVQLIVGAPFLLTHPFSYLRASFDLGRVFEYRWTVNFRFLPPDVFASRWLHIGLMFLHVLLLLAFAPLAWRYFKSYATLSQALKDMRASSAKGKARLAPKSANMAESGSVRRRKTGKAQSSAISPPLAKACTINFSKITQLFVLPFFSANLIGVACARSLHYQFYAWYFHSLIYIGFSTHFSKPLVFLMLAVVEACWNVYPSTVWSSALLHLVHVALIAGLYKSMKIH